FRTAVERRLLPVAMEGVWRLPFNTKASIDASGAVGYWVTAGEPIPASAFAARAVRLPPKPVGALVSLAKELIEASGASVDAALTRILSRALAKAVNGHFLSDADATDGAPAGIAGDAETITATGNDAADLAALVTLADETDLDLREATWILSP